MRTLSRVSAVAMVIGLAALAPAPASAVTLTKGSPLASPANGGWGCETSWLPDLMGNYQRQASGYASCTWWQPGTTTDNTAFVPNTGKVTKVRVKSGPNPAPLTVVVLRRLFKIKNGAQVDYICCGAIKESAIFQPTPNAVTEVPVDLLVETNPSPGEGKTGWYDLIGISGRGPGELPFATVGPQTLAAGQAANVLVPIGYYPHTPPPTGFNFNDQTIPNTELLMQYDWTDGCPETRSVLRQACSPGTATPGTPGGGTTGTPGTPTPGTTGAKALAQVRSSKLTLKGGKVAVSVRCATGTGKACAARVRLRTRAKKPVLLASRKATIKDGASGTVRLSLSAKARKRLKAKATKVRVEIDLGAQGKVTRDVTLRKP